MVLEGIDGSGISTQIARVSQVLSAKCVTPYRKIMTTKQPGTGPVGSLIRQVLAKRLHGVDPTTLALLFAADRQDHLAQEVRPVLEAGGIVICDRYLWSTLAYQGLDLDEAWLRQINKFSIVPDLTVLIKVRPAVSMKRIEAGRLRAELFEQETMLERVYANFMTLASEAKDAGDPIMEVDGEQSVEDVTAEIVEGALRKGIFLKK
ncbi:MAG: dTMP kinase [Peptococcaceae bacterium]|nr:dTMP kinase [Peptococcaceae bacterium]